MAIQLVSRRREVEKKSRRKRKKLKADISEEEGKGKKEGRKNQGIEARGKQDLSRPDEHKQKHHRFHQGKGPRMDRAKREWREKDEEKNSPMYEAITSVHTVMLRKEVFPC
jgi:hypothetical protein